MLGPKELEDLLRFKSPDENKNDFSFSTADVFEDSSFALREFECPLSFEIMTDAVIAPDGRNYEKKTIEDRIKKSQGKYLSPFDKNKIITLESLIPNIALRNAIESQKKIYEEIQRCFHKGEESKSGFFFSLTVAFNDSRFALPEFNCSLSSKIMTDPVIAPDGRSYERKIIEDTINKSQGAFLSPFDKNKIITLKSLIPNMALRDAIESQKKLYKEMQRWFQQREEKKSPTNDKAEIQSTETPSSQTEKPGSPRKEKNLEYLVLYAVCPSKYITNKLTINNVHACNLTFYLTLDALKKDKSLHLEEASTCIVRIEADTRATIKAYASPYQYHLSHNAHTKYNIEIKIIDLFAANPVALDKICNSINKKIRSMHEWVNLGSSISLISQPSLDKIMQEKLEVKIIKLFKLLKKLSTETKTGFFYTAHYNLNKKINSLREKYHETDFKAFELWHNEQEKFQTSKDDTFTAYPKP